MLSAVLPLGYTVGPRCCGYLWLGGGGHSEGSVPSTRPMVRGVAHAHVLLAHARALPWLSFPHRMACRRSLSDISWVPFLGGAY